MSIAQRIQTGKMKQQQPQAKGSFSRYLFKIKKNFVLYICCYIKV